MKALFPFKYFGASTAVMLLLAATLLFSPAGSLAQSQNTGTVSGNVTDGQGGLVANATIVLKSLDEGKETTVRSDARGEYLVPNVKSGSYTITVSAPTFQNYTANALQVSGGENVNLDAKLVRGSASETVTVDAPAATVDTRSSTIATVIDPTLVQELPIDGNNIVATAALLPGVTDVFAPTTFTSDTGGPSFNSSGARSNQNLFLFDGLYWNNVFFNTGLNFPASQMLQEVSVQLNGFKAQYGRNVGSVFNALSRSGSNAIHGQLWEYIQNKALNAADYFGTFTNAQGQVVRRNPHLVQNQFGATIGGPIKRDKIFYFIGYQDLRSSTEVDTRAQTFTPAELGLNPDGSAHACITPAYAGLTCGDFTNDFNLSQPFIVNTIAQGNAGIAQPFYTSTSGPAIQIQNAYISQLNSTYYANGGAPGTNSPCIQELIAAQPDPTKHYFKNLELPTNCYNPVALNVVNRYITAPVDTLGYLPTAYLKVTQPRNDQQGLARVDWSLGRHTVDARFFKTSSDDQTANGASTTSNSLAGYEISANSAGITAGNIGDTWVLSANILNSLRAGYKRYVYGILPLDTTTLQGLGGAFANPGYPVLPRFSVGSRFSAGSGNQTLSGNVNANFELLDSINWSHGKHNYQFGVQYLDLQYIHRFDQILQFSSGGNYTGIAGGDFLLGLASNVTVGNSTDVGAIQHAFYFYGQDDFRVTSRLTLNLGLRYELPKPWYQPNGHSVTFIPGHQSYKFPNTPSSLAYQGDPGVPDAIIKTNYTNLAPRFGFTYDVFGNGKLAIRGGFGIFYEALNANTTGFGQPYHYQASYSFPNGSFSNPLLGLPSVPANFTDNAHAVFGQPISVTFADPNVTEPYTESTSLGLQMHFGSALLETNYVGRFGRHQLIPFDLNYDIYDCSGAYFQANPALYCAPFTKISDSGGNVLAQYGIQGGSADNSLASSMARARYPGFNYGGQGIVDQNSVGTSNYNALQIIYVQRSRRTLTTTMSYTYSRSLDEQSIGTTSSNSSPFVKNLNANYAPSDFNSTHVVNAGWSLHFPPLKTGFAIERALINDWSFGGIFNARSGHPFNVQLGGDFLLDGEPNQRPPLATGLDHYTPLPKNRHRNEKIAQWFNVCQFQDGAGGSPAGSGGNTPCNVSQPLTPGFTNGISRNFLIGPAFIESDFSVRRQFLVPRREGWKLDFRIDAYNVFNTVNLAQPNSTVSSSGTYGFITPGGSVSSGQGSITGSVGKSGAGTNGRRLQLEGTLRF